MKKFDVILFDADDTLFDFEKSEEYCLDKTFNDFKIAHNSEIKTCWFNQYNIENKTDIKSTYEISNLKELFAIVGYEALL